MFAGENACHINMRMQISDEFMSLDIPDQLLLRAIQKMNREQKQLDRAILTTVHHYSGIDLGPGLAAEGRQERHWENYKIGAVRRAGA